MNTATALIVAIFSLFTPKDSNDCETAYQDAAIGYQQIKQSMKSRNLEHTQLYVSRAKDALEKANLTLKSCGCAAAENASFDAMEHLEKSLEKDTYERSRFHVSKAKISAQLILSSLDVCGENGLLSTIDEEEETLLNQEEKLLAQQQRLLEEQKKIEAKIKKQKELQQRLQSEKKQKLEQQLTIKREAETSLNELKQSIINTTKSLECSTEAFAKLDSFYRSEEALEAETVQATRLFYAQKTEEMVHLLLKALEECK